MTLFPTSPPAFSTGSNQAVDANSPQAGGTGLPRTGGTGLAPASGAGLTRAGGTGLTLSSPFNKTPNKNSQSFLPAGSPQSVPASSKIRVSNEEFIQLRDFIYSESGIWIAEARAYLVENRLNNRLKELNLKNFSEYYYYLRFDPNRKSELPKLFEVITTNETSFYRNPPQLQIFQDKVLKAELDKLRAAQSKKLRIWSAGCSTGEEPYTIAMILHETLHNELPVWDIKITANDLSEAVLATARKGIYSDYSLRTTPKEISDRYFKKVNNEYQVMPRLANLISFGPINLNDAMMLRRVERSHIIFCRNVIIYFDDEVKRRVIESFYDNLLPGGCLLIGHSESLHSISRAFKPEHHAGTIVYRKES